MEYEYNPKANYLTKSAKKFIKQFKTHCRYCGVIEPELHIDHIIPKSKGGEHHISNLTIACKSCNGSKGVFTIDEWINSCSNNKDNHLEKVNYYNTVFNNPLRNKNHIRQDDDSILKKIYFHKYHYEKYCIRLKSLKEKTYKLLIDESYI